MIITASKPGLVISLPIYTPTGKVRVKRLKEGFISEPLASRSRKISEDDYVEWMISYDTDNLNEDSIMKNVILQKDSGVRYGCELVKMMVEGYKLSLFSEQQIKELVKLLKLEMEGIEEKEGIKKTIGHEDSDKLMEGFGFTKYQLITPNYIKNGDKYNIEIKIEHKQRAVGYQATIYLNLPMVYCVSKENKPLIGRTAERKEEVDYLIDMTNKNIIYDTVLAFALASLKHRRDMQNIFCSLHYDI